MTFHNPKFLLISGIACVLLALKSPLQAQDDLHSWTSMTLTLEVSDALEIELEEQLRLKEDLSEVDELFTDVALYYNLSKKWALGGGIRYSRENDNVGRQQGYETHFRYHFDALFKHKIHNLSLKYRGRYQHKKEWETTNIPKEHFRLKTYLTYNIKNWKLDPRFTGELFYSTTSNTAREADKYRLSLGTQYKFKSFGKLAVFYQLEKQLNRFVNKSIGIIGLKYSYTLNLQK